MKFGEKFVNFLYFVWLTVVTLGIYPLWWFVNIQEEWNKLLRELAGHEPQG